MKRIMNVLAMVAALSAATGCNEKKEDFKYLLDEFADLKVMRYTIPGWEELSLQQKEYAYHLAEAAKWGIEIHWDQNCKYNIPLRKALVQIYDNYKGDRSSSEWAQFDEYAKRVFFSSGIHHHYAEDKFFPACPKEYFATLLAAVRPSEDAAQPSEAAQSAIAPSLDAALLLDYIYSTDKWLQRRSTSPDGDIVALSAVNFYDGVSREEVESYYASVAVKDDPAPVAYGLNSKVVKKDGRVCEEQWKSGGIYGAAIDRICEELEAAAKVAESDLQRGYIALLVKYYRTGDLRVWDEYNVAWVKDTACTVDFINGFIEDYNDPLGRKGSWEGLVNIKDEEASRRTAALCENAQWFEDNAPVDPRFKKAKCKGVSAKVVNAVCLAGDAYPATPIGINLPNADWIRKEHGSKSVTIANITAAYDKAALESPASTLAEFAWDEAEVELYKKYGAYVSDIHTDLHECLGHGSGQLLPGVSSTAMGEFSSTLEEARADLFGLYYVADPKMIELGIIPDSEAYKAEYSNYIRNGLMVQFTRVELGRQNTEAHMQNRQLIAAWCYEQGAADNVIEKKTRDGKTYFVVNDYEKLRTLFGRLLGEIQRIKSEGDYAAGKALVEKYAVNIDPVLHKEVRERYAALNLKPYGGFINPTIVPVKKGGKVVDYVLEYGDNYMEQSLDYARRYSNL